MDPAKTEPTGARSEPATASDRAIEMLACAHAVIFDFDGVLVDSEPLHEEAIRRIAAANGWSMSAEQFRRMVGKGDEHAFELLARENGQAALLGVESLAALCAAKHRECLSLIEAGMFSVQPGAPELVAALVHRGVPMAVCSGSRREVVLGMLRSCACELGRHLQEVVTHESVKSPKPAPEGYLLAAARVGVEPARCLVIEDSPTGIRAGKAAGMAVLAVAHSFPPDRLAEADAVAESLASLHARSG